MNSSELANSIKLLMLMLVSFGVMLGFIRLARLPQILVRILIIPMVLGILFAMGRQGWGELPPVQQAMALLVVLPIGLIILLRIALGKEIFKHVIGNLVYDLLKNGFFFFFRLIGAVFAMPVWFFRWLWAKLGSGRS